MAKKVVEHEVCICDLCGDERNFHYKCDFCGRHMCPRHERSLLLEIGERRQYSSDKYEVRRRLCDECEEEVIALFQKLMPEDKNA